MKFEASIKMDNAAFEDAPASELARILRAIAARVEAGTFDGFEWDINGNRVASWAVTGKAEG